jgi:fumarate hydratase class II
MACVQIMGNDMAINIGGASGNFELSVCKPLIARYLLQSTRLIADAANSFNQYCVVGIHANRGRIDELLHRSIVLVTALNPHIGYDKCAQIANKAHIEGTTLHETAMALGYVTTKEFERWVHADKMVEK